jgi:hypothetical protein
MLRSPAVRYPVGRGARWSVMPTGSEPLRGCQTSSGMSQRAHASVSMPAAIIEKPRSHPGRRLGARKAAAATTGSHHATNQRAKVRAGRVCAAPPAGPTTSISAFSVLRRITKVFDDDKSHVCHPEMADVGPTNRSTFARTHQLRHVAASSDRPAGETASDG